jgi:protein phosphatase
MRADRDTQEYPAQDGGRAAAPPRPWSSQVQVDVAGLTHPGKVRPNNEDHFLTIRFGRSMDTLQTSLPAGHIPARYAEVGYGLAVADGIGGAVAGEVASGLAITAGLNLALHSPQWNLVMTPEQIRASMETWRQRFHDIDALVAERARADAGLAGMGTTLTVAYSVGHHLLLHHVGDSRAYLFRGGRLQRLTRDHTVAQSLADAGVIAPDEVASHRLRHVLTRALGSGRAEVEAEIQHVELADGDRLLLCTDGLTEMVADARIAEVLGRTAGSAEAGRALVEAALEAGGRDNVTVVVAGYGIPAGPPPDPPGTDGAI